jgi:hypothetical protein
MAREFVGTGDGNTLVFTTSAPYFDELLTVGEVPVDPDLYTLSGTTITFLAGAFPTSPTPGAPPSGDRIFIRGSTGATSTTTAAPHNYTAESLIQLVRDMTYAGPSTRDWDDARILRAFNRLIDSYLMPFVMKARKNNFVTYKDQTLVANQAAYFMPSAATGGKLRALHIVDSTGQVYADLTEAPLEDVINFDAGVSPTPSGSPRLYYFLGNKVVLFPSPSGLPAGLLLRSYFPARPNALVLSTSCVQISSFPVGAPAGSFRIGYTGTAPSGFVTNAGTDLVQNVPGFDVLLSGSISASGSGYFETVGTRPTPLALGDWFCLSDTAPVVTGAIADLVIDCLVQKVALEVMAGKDKQGFEVRSKLLGTSERLADAFLRRRNEGDHAKVGGGALSRYRRGWAQY